MQLSSGPWAYNRFDQYEQSLTEGKKPDFLDVDKDGDKKESFKKAESDKKKKCDDCGKEDCGCDDKKSEKKDDKKDDKKPAFLQKEAIINSLMADGLANNPVSAEIIAEHMSEAWAQAILDEAG